MRCSIRKGIVDTRNRAEVDNKLKLSLANTIFQGKQNLFNQSAKTKEKKDKKDKKKKKHKKEVKNEDEELV